MDKQIECQIKGWTRFTWINVAMAVWLGMFIYAQTQPISDTVYNLSHTHFCCGRGCDQNNSSSLCARDPGYWIIDPLQGFIILNIVVAIPAVVYPHHTQAWFVFRSKDCCETPLDNFNDVVRILYWLLVASDFLVASVLFFRAANTVCPVPINGTYISKFYEAQPIEAAGITVMMAIMWPAIAALVLWAIFVTSRWFIRTYWCECKSVDHSISTTLHGAPPTYNQHSSMPTTLHGAPPTYSRNSSC